MGKNENAVTRACIQWINYNGGKAVRVQSGMMKWGEGKMMRLAENGTADIIGSWKGKALAVECKSAKGKQRPSQVEWQQEWERAGGVYVLARGIEDLERTLA